MKRIRVALIHQHLGHQDCVYTLERAPGKGKFFSAGADGVVAEWSKEQADAVRAMLQSDRPIYALSHDTERDWLIIGQNDGGLHVLDIANREVLASKRAHQDAIFDVQQLPGGESFAAVSRDGTLSVWRKTDLNCGFTAHISNESLRSIALSPDGKLLAVGGSDNHIRVYNSEDFKLIHKWEAHENSVFRVVFSPDGRFLVSGSRDAHLKAWDIRQNYHLHKDVVAHMFAINDLVYSPDGSLLASASMDKTIKLWDPQTFSLLKVIDKRRNNSHTTSVNRVLWTTPCNRLISVSDDRAVLHWDLEMYEVED